MLNLPLTVGDDLGPPEWLVDQIDFYMPATRTVWRGGVAIGKIFTIEGSAGIVGTGRAEANVLAAAAAMSSLDVEQAEPSVVVELEDPNESGKLQRVTIVGVADGIAVTPLRRALGQVLNLKPQLPKGSARGLKDPNEFRPRRR